MPASEMARSRIVYGRAFRITPLWLWIAQRASGLLLGPLVALHIWVPGLAASRALQFVLLALIVAHGYGGVRRMVLRENKAALFAGLALAWCAAVAALGLLIVFSGG